MYQVSIRQILPRPELRRIVHHFELFELTGCFPEEGMTVFPSFAVGFFFAFYREQPMKFYHPTFGENNFYSAALISPGSRPVSNYDIRDFTAIRVIFVPGVMHQLYHIPLSVVTDQLLELPSVLDSEIAELYEQLYEETDPLNQIACIEYYLLRKAEGKSIDQKLYTAVEKTLQGHNYDLSAQKMADQLGLSRRHLNRKFNEAFGRPVKAFLKTYRFCSVLKHLQREPLVSLSDTAYRFGYTDQAHLSHEFKQMVGQTPGQYLATLGKRAFYGSPEDIRHIGIIMPES